MREQIILEKKQFLHKTHKVTIGFFTNGVVSEIEIGNVSIKTNDPKEVDYYKCKYAETLRLFEAWGYKTKKVLKY